MCSSDLIFFLLFSISQGRFSYSVFSSDHASVDHVLKIRERKDEPKNCIGRVRNRILNDVKIIVYKKTLSFSVNNS